MIVADTCVVIWLGTDPDLLTKPAVRAIKDARNADGIGISGMTLYEIAWLAIRKRITLAMTLPVFLHQVERQFIVLPVTGSVARIAAELPLTYPLDPTDRIIGATALDRGIPLVTADGAIRKSKALKVIW